MLFGAMMNALKIVTRIVHDFLDHCWNEAMIQGKWIHIDSTLAYPISVNHPHYYEQNWGKKYEYLLAFSSPQTTISVLRVSAGFSISMVIILGI